MTFVVLDIETTPDLEHWTPPTPDAFPPTFAHRIVCVGMFGMTNTFEPLRALTLTGTEPEILTALANVMRRSPAIVTFNGRGFDMPVILQRSLAARVPQPWWFASRDYRYRYSFGNHACHIDVCDELTEHGAAKMLSLDAATRLVDLEGKGATTGADVAALVAADDIAAIERYCLDDVRQTAILFVHLMHLRGAVATDALERICARIAAHFEPRK